MMSGREVEEKSEGRREGKVMQESEGDGERDERVRREE